MTVGQFKKFVSMFTLNDSQILYFDYIVFPKILREELDIEDIDDNYIVSAYTMVLDTNQVYVFVRAV